MRFKSFDFEGKEQIKETKGHRLAPGFLKRNSLTGENRDRINSSRRCERQEVGRENGVLHFDNWIDSIATLNENRSTPFKPKFESIEIDIMTWIYLNSLHAAQNELSTCDASDVS